MFWHDRTNPAAVYLDNRYVTHQLPDCSTKGGSRTLTICPNVVGDFTALPFKDRTFGCVVFDPPHLTGAGSRGWMARKYGVLRDAWREDIQRGFAEGFRVLQLHGTLVLKWSQHSIPIRTILALTEQRPLFGSQNNRQLTTHWIVFLNTGGRSR